MKWGIPTVCISNVQKYYVTLPTLTPTHRTVTCRVLVSLILVSILFKSAIKGSTLILSNNRRCTFPEKWNNVQNPEHWMIWCLVTRTYRETEISIICRFLKGILKTFDLNACHNCLHAFFNKSTLGPLKTKHEKEKSFKNLALNRCAKLYSLNSCWFSSGFQKRLYKFQEKCNQHYAINAND